MADTIDELDRRLIQLLRANGRESVVNLAKKLGVTRATVNHRIDRLVQNGVIVGFSVRVRDVTDADAVRAIMVISVRGRNTDDVIRELRGIPEISALHTTNGIVRGIKGIHDSETSILLSSAAS